MSSIDQIKQATNTTHNALVMLTNALEQKQVAIEDKEAILSAREKDLNAREEKLVKAEQSVKNIRTELSKARAEKIAAQDQANKSAERADKAEADRRTAVAEVASMRAALKTLGIVLPQQPPAQPKVEVSSGIGEAPIQQDERVALAGGM